MVYDIFIFVAFIAVMIVPGLVGLLRKGDAFSEESAKTERDAFTA